MSGYEFMTIDPDEEALHEVFRQCGAMVQARGCSTTGVAMHSKNNLDGAIRSVVRDDLFKVLDRDDKLDLNGVTIQLLPERAQVRKLDGPVLGAFANPSKLNKIIACSDVIDIAFPPLAAEDHPAYLEAQPS